MISSKGPSAKEMVGYWIQVLVTIDGVQIGNGSCLPISYIGSSTLVFNNKYAFSLQTLLHTLFFITYLLFV